MDNDDIFDAYVSREIDALDMADTEGTIAANGPILAGTGLVLLPCRCPTHVTPSSQRRRICANTK